MHWRLNNNNNNLDKPEQYFYIYEKLNNKAHLWPYGHV